MLSLTEEGAQYAENGMPEAQILHRVAQAGAAGIPQDELQVIGTSIGLAAISWQAATPGCYPRLMASSENSSCACSKAWGR